jgi:hypothetical protein
MNPDLELVTTVASDLRFLASTWGTQVDDDSLRRGSAQLRVLLVDGALQRAWKALGFDREPIIKGPQLEPFLNVNADIEFALAGGGNYEGVQGAFAIFNKGSMPAIDPPNADLEYAFGLKRFGESCSMFVNGLRVSRRDVVKYVANKLGGAHLDFSRTEEKSAALRSMEARFKYFGKNAVYFELLSIGQLIAQSASVQRFLSRQPDPAN